MYLLLTFKKAVKYILRPENSNFNIKGMIGGYLKWHIFLTAFVLVQVFTKYRQITFQISKQTDYAYHNASLKWFKTPLQTTR